MYPMLARRLTCNISLVDFKGYITMMKRSAVLD